MSKFFKKNDREVWMNMLGLSEQEELENRRTRIKQLEREEKERKLKIVVEDINDLKEKYSDYNIHVYERSKEVYISKPMEVHIFGMYRNDCNRLGFSANAESNCADDIYYRRGY